MTPRLHLRVGICGALAPVLLVLALAGCGGASTPTVSDTGASRGSDANPRAATRSAPHRRPTDSKAQFIAGAEAICARSNADIASIKPKSTTRKEIERVVPRHAAFERAALAELEKLQPPRALAKSWAGMLSARRSLARQLDELLADAKKQKTPNVIKFAGAKQEAHLKLENAARAGGFTQCGTVG